MCGSSLQFWWLGLLGGHWCHARHQGTRVSTRTFYSFPRLVLNRCLLGFKHNTGLVQGANPWGRSRLWNQHTTHRVNIPPANAGRLHTTPYPISHCLS